MELIGSTKLVTPQLLTDVVEELGCPEGKVTVTVERLVYGVRDVVQDAIGKLNAMEERWAEEDLLTDEDASDE